MTSKPDDDARDAFLRINDTPIYFHEDWDTGIGGGLWSTGLAMAKYFQCHTTKVRRSIQCIRPENLTVLELGSGNGFLSVCLMAAAHDLVGTLVITDTEDHLSLIKKTIAENAELMSAKDDQASPKVIIAEHKWGQFERENVENLEKPATTLLDGSHQFDLIFGSDLAYREHLYAPLIASLKRLCHSRTIFLLGVTMKDTRPKFFHLLRDAGFHYTRLPDDLMVPEFRGTTFGIFVIQKRKGA